MSELIEAIEQSHLSSADLERSQELQPAVKYLGQDRWPSTSLLTSLAFMKLILAALATSTFLVAGCTSETFVAESPSMEPSIPRGSKVVVDLSAYNSAAPTRFDVVVFHPPTNKDHVFMFRVLALPGEHITLGDSKIEINGADLSIPGKIVYSSSASGHPATYNNLTLGKNEYYLVGDNVAGANDSRFIGPVPREAIMGKVVEIRSRQ